MATFEERLFGKDKDAQERFRESARAALGTREGRVVLEMLCAAAHPLEHTALMQPHDHGRAEVVAALWRYGSGDASLLTPDIKA